MEGFGIEKLTLILVIVLVLFGARRVPEIGASIGKGIREFKRGMNDLGKEEDDRSAPPPRIASTTANDMVEARSDPKRLLDR
ncbi:MAG TPA: twin-arginine translocase TatA/TatE family subunit [Gemmatimonadaceae bacterium]